MLLALVGVVVLSAAKWRWSVQVALVLTVFEGALRKWVFPGLSQYIYFLKDFVLLGAYIGYYTSSAPKPSRLNPGLAVPLVVGWGAVLLQALNPNLGSIITGAFGVKAYLWYVPLLWILPAVFRDKDELFRFTRCFIILAVPLGILAIAQFNAPLDSPLNAYATETETVSSFGEDASRAQVTGTFSYISGYTSFLLLTFCLLVPNLLGSQKPIVLWSHAAVLCLLLGNMCMTGSRKNFVFIGLCLAVLSVTVLKQRHLLAGVHRTIFAGATVIGMVLMLFSTAVDAIIGRARAGEDFAERTSLFLPLLKSLPTVGVSGYGTGVSLAARSDLASALNVSAPKSLPPYIDLEANQVLYELGAAGFLAWYALRIALLWGLWTTWERVRDSRLKLLAAGAFTFHLAHLYLSVYLNHIANVYFWFMAGFILVLPRLDATAPAAHLGRSSRGRPKRRGRRTSPPVAVTSNTVPARFPQIGWFRSGETASI